MEFRKENIEIFDQFLRNEMSSKEKQIMEQRLESDAEFRKEFESFKLFEQAIRDAEVLEIQNQVSGFEQEITAKKPKTRYLYWASGIAAAMLAIFGINYFMGGSGDAIVSDHFTPYANITTVRGKKEVISEGMLHYDKGEYQDAIQLLEQYPNDTVALFYTAESYLATKAYQKAITCYDQLLENKTVFDEISLFHKALAHIGAGQNSEAISVLKDISEESHYHSEAESVLRDLQ